MSNTRAPAGVALGLVVLLGLTACGGSTADDDAAPTGPSGATASADATGSTDAMSSTDATAWAGAVCVAADDVEASLDALGTSVQVDIGSGTNLADQVVPQIESQVGDVGDSVSQLAATVASVPQGTDPELSAAADDLDVDRQALEGSLDGLRAAAGSLSEASGGAAVVDGVRAVATQLALVRLDAVTFADSLRTTAQQGSTAVRTAFAEAPSCEGRV